VVDGSPVAVRLLRPAPGSRAVEPNLLSRRAAAGAGWTTTTQPTTIMTSVMSPRSSVGAGSSTAPFKDDPTRLTSFNPFEEADENDQSSYTLVTALFSRVKNSIASVTTSTNSTNSPPTQPAPTPTVTSPQPPAADSKRPPLNPHISHATRSSERERKPIHGQSKLRLSSSPAKPLVSLNSVLSDLPSVDRDDRQLDRPPSRTESIPFCEPSPETHGFGTSIPGFQLPDDARSIRSTTTPIRRSASVSKVIRRMRGEGTLSLRYITNSDTHVLPTRRSISGLLDG
jgi:1-phosphatidylinositol-3-phosphate 5-kinase